MKVAIQSPSSYTSRVIARPLLLLVIIVIFLYFFCIMVVSFYHAVGIILQPPMLYTEAKREAIKIFNMIATGLVFSFIISLITLILESRCCR